MAKSPTDAPQPKIDPAAEYAVKLNRAVPFGSMILRPKDAVRVKGKTLVALGDAVESYEKV